MLVHVFELNMLKIIDNLENWLFFMEIKNEFSEKKRDLIFNVFSKAFDLYDSQYSLPSPFR